MRSFGFALERNAADVVGVPVTTEEQVELLQHLFDFSSDAAEHNAAAVLPCRPVVYRCAATGRELSAWEARAALWQQEQDAAGTLERLCPK
jgi:hypothetical protein